MKEKITYKGFNKDFTYKGFQYEIGGEYEIEGDVKLCKKGFHACENPFGVLDFYSGVDSRYCEVIQSGDIVKDDKKTVSSKIKIIKEIGFVGLMEAGIKWMNDNMSPDLSHCDIREHICSDDFAQIGSSGYSAQIGISGNFAQIGSSGNSAQIGSSGYSAHIESTGLHSVINCSGDKSSVKAKKGSWITLSEWKYDINGNYYPSCVKTEYVDGVRIKEDTWYTLINGEFVEQNT